MPLVNISANITADSSLGGALTDWNSSMVADSSVTAPLTVVWTVASNPTADSSFTAGPTIVRGVTSSLAATSSVSATLLLRNILFSNVTADSSLSAALFVGRLAAVNILADSSFTAAPLIPLSASLVADSSVLGEENSEVAAIIATSAVTAALTIKVAGVSSFHADSAVTAAMGINYAITASLLANSSAVGTAELNLIAVAVSPTTVRVIFPAPVLNDAFLNDPMQYAITDLAGNALTIVSAKPEITLNPTTVALVLSAPLPSSNTFKLRVQASIHLVSGGSIVPDTAIFTWVADTRGLPIIIPLNEFTGEVEGGLFGIHGGLVFFSPALNVAASNSIIQVEEVDVCTTAFDTYTFPHPPDPPALFTYNPATPLFDSPLGPGTVLWGAFPRLSEARFTLEFTGSHNNDAMPLALDGPATATFQEQWDLSYVALLNNPTWRLFNGTGTTTPPVFITAKNTAAIPPGPTTVIQLEAASIAAHLVANSTFHAVAVDVLSANIVANSSVSGTVT